MQHFCCLHSPALKVCNLSGFPARNPKKTLCFEVMHLKNDNRWSLTLPTATPTGEAAIDGASFESISSDFLFGRGVILGYKTGLTPENQL